jgi:ABC-type Zn2+ transport system substrate-binding protein/surface adhesin
MKRKLVFIIPGILLLAFLAFKPPAIGSEKGNVIVTPEATITPSTKPQLRDFDDEGTEPEHFDDHKKHEEQEHHDDELDEDHGREHHDEDHEDDDD